jgi:teichuronic acid biosynthesis glycosyltransferase TuaG
MKLDKKISVIIPTYNSSSYIRRAIESVKKQTYSNWEIVIIDGGSSDNTLNLLRQFDKSKIKVFYLPKENGLAASRYYGICKASGNYVAFLDSDDFWDILCSK